MKRLFFRLLMILLPFLVVFLVIEFKASRLPNSYAQKKRGLEGHAREVNVLVLGSSHAFDDINPDYFSCRGYNMANVSQSFCYDTRLCLEYLDRLPSLKSVIITVSYFSLFYEMNDLPEGWREFFYYRYFGIRHPSLDLTDPRIFSYTALYTRDFITAMLVSKVDSINEFGDIQPSGWKKVTAPADSFAISDSTGQKLAMFHHSLIRMQNLNPNLHYLREMLSELRKRNIRVCFVMTPVYPAYSDHLHPFIIRANRSVIQELSREYGAVFLDYLNDVRFRKSDFADNDHLNDAGAKKFSQILDRDFVAESCLK
jgi:hypothetical protein